MEILIIGLALFVAAHLVPARPALRAGLVERLGPVGYRAVFGLVSLAGFVLIVYGFGMARAQGVPVLYDPPPWTRHIAMLLMLFAFILIPAAYLPGRIKATVKHPMITAVKTWALAHLLVNGDAASLVLFLTFLAWGVYDRISLKRRPAPESVRGSMRNDILAVVIGVVLYAAFVWKLHLWLIGVPILT
ncbi:putative membrane protein [Breoghania corrubedonensis]|uniref:Putative membrane protein n=1 Tax=Breoghania corrubedonensis TaxID=665038 RepID=A0A2T5V9M9_9HYPH|nr:NnrU family protein [Breoghania corrubedonensis]PTW60463.1 putative membrane protein [Breoghania corrubedonensis]